MNAMEQITDYDKLNVKRLKGELTKDLLPPNYTNISIYSTDTDGIKSYTMYCNFDHFNVKIIIPNNYPFKAPVIFINEEKFEFSIQEWSPQKTINTVIRGIITDKVDKYRKQFLFVPNVYGFLMDETERSFNSNDLHEMGHLYECRNFENKKYQFGSGFIYSILNQYFKEYLFKIDKHRLDMFIDRLLEYPIIKEIGCVYLVLKIYEEKLIFPIENYVEKINMYLISNDVKQQFNMLIHEFKKNNKIIMLDLIERVDHLNHILTIYINIWAYANFNLLNREQNEISFDLNTIINTFLRNETKTDLYEWSIQFIGRDKRIADFNAYIFEDNYDYIMNYLRIKNEHLTKCVLDFLSCIKQFNNFSNEMFHFDVEQYTIAVPKLGYRLAEFKKMFPHTRDQFPISLVHIQSAENNICSTFNLQLEDDMTKLIPDNLCLHYP
jgi:hypothetical protein